VKGQGLGALFAPAVHLVLPWPPSVNTYWRHPGGGKHLISEQGRFYRAAVLEAVFVAGYARLGSAPVSVAILANQPDKRRRDLDNLLKAPLDALSHARVWDDDSQIQELSIRWGTGTKGTLAIAITPLEAKCK